ncbi:MAG: CBO0543 family protein [Bacillota bacterium]|nr:CBO0543 family protein [Bacillota bacterium]
MNNLYILDQVYKLNESVNRMLLDIWMKQIVFSWRWWVEILLAIIPWILWIKFRDKKATDRLLFVGLLVFVVTNTLDNIGIAYNAWHYDWNVLPIVPIYLPWDFTLFPILVMWLLQYKPNISPLVKALVFSAFNAFLMEPLFQYFSFYHPVAWKQYYSFIIYIPLYLFFNYVSKRKFLENL